MGVLTFFLIFHNGWNQAKCTEPVFQKKSFAKTLEDSTQMTKLRKKSPTGALLRSLVFPGLGQWYNEQKIKAAIAFSAESFLVGLAVYFNNKAKQSEPGSTERNFYKDRRNLTFWVLGGVTLFSMIDAYVDAYLYDFDTGPELALRLGTLPTSTSMERPFGLGLSLRAKF